jgi:hypothetical protein
MGSNPCQTGNLGYFGASPRCRKAFEATLRFPAAVEFWKALLVMALAQRTDSLLFGNLLANETSVHNV